MDRRMIDEQYEQAIYEELMKYHRIHRENIAYYLPDGTLLPSGSSIKGNPIQQDCQIEGILYLLIFKYQIGLL